MQTISQPTGSGRPFRVPSHRLTAALAVMACAAAPAWALVIDNGTTNVIDTTIDDFIDVFDSSAGDPTTVTFNTGANITGVDAFDTSVYVDDNSIVIINDGSFAQDITGFGNASITVNGGDLGDDIFLAEQATAFISGGMIDENVELVDDTSVTITGGTIGDNLTVENDATAEVFGGSVGDDVEAIGGGARVTLRGGDFGGDIEAARGGEIDIFGGEIGTNPILFDTGIGASSFSTITLYGQDFTIDGSPVGFGAISPLSGTLAGTLSDGSTFSMPFQRINTRPFFRPPVFGDIVLVDQPVPEPSTLALLAIGSAALLRRATRSA